MANKDVKIVISAKDNASKEIKKLQGNFKRFSLNMRTVAQDMVGPLKVAGASLLGLGTYGLKIAGDFEQTRVSFETMLGSAEKAQTLLKQLSEFAAETPFEFPEIAQAGKSLLAFGFEAENIQENLTRLGDIASGLNIPFTELSDIYGKIRVQGRLYQEDINQLTGRGIPIIQELAKQFGVTEAEVKKLVESGKVGFPQIEEAFKNLTKEGSQFGGMMEKQSKTLNGQISTLKDNLKNTLMEIIGINQQGDIKGGSIFEKFTTAVGELNKQLETNGPKIEEHIENILKVIEGGIWILKTSVEWWYKLGNAMGWFAAQVTIKGSKITKDFNGTLETVITDLKQSEGQVGPVAQKWGVNLVTMMANGINEKIVESKVVKVAKTISDYLGFHSPTEKGPASDSDTWMPNLIKMLSDGLYKGYTDVDKAAAKVASALGTQLGKGMNLEVLKENISKMKDTITEAFGDLSGEISGQKSKVLGLVEEYKSLQDQLKKVGENGVKEIEKINDAIDKQKQKIQDIQGEGQVNVAERALEIEKELQSLRSGDYNSESATKIQALEKELELAKQYAGNEAIERQRIENAKSETQLIIDRFEQKKLEAEQELVNIENQKTARLTAIEEEKTAIKNQMEEKEALIRAENDLYISLVKDKAKIDKLYFEFFESRIDRQIDKTKEAITLLQKLNSASGGGGNELAGTRANGGPVSGGKTYLVGERGPELFTPQKSGNIIPNNQMSSTGGNTININLGGVSVNSMSDMDTLVNKIKKALTNEAKLYNIGIT